MDIPNVEETMNGTFSDICTLSWLDEQRLISLFYEPCQCLNFQSGQLYFLCEKHTGGGVTEKVMIITQLVVRLLVLPAKSKKATTSLRSLAVLE